MENEQEWDLEELSLASTEYVNHWDRKRVEGSAKNLEESPVFKIDQVSDKINGLIARTEAVFVQGQVNRDSFMELTKTQFLEGDLNASRCWFAVSAEVLPDNYNIGWSADNGYMIADVVAAILPDVLKEGLVGSDATPRLMDGLMDNLGVTAEERDSQVNKLTTAFGVEVDYYNIIRKTIPVVTKKVIQSVLEDVKDRSRVHGRGNMTFAVYLVAKVQKALVADIPLYRVFFPTK